MWLKQVYIGNLLAGLANSQWVDCQQTPGVTNTCRGKIKLEQTQESKAQRIDLLTKRSWHLPQWANVLYHWARDTGSIPAGGCFRSFPISPPTRFLFLSLSSLVNKNIKSPKKQNKNLLQSEEKSLRLKYWPTGCKHGVSETLRNTYYRVHCQHFCWPSIAVICSSS